jgi:hypothetical protein
MRAVVLLVVVGLAGCFGASQNAEPGDDSGVAPPDDLVCASDADCRPAGASCCGCPEYAVNAQSDFAQACEDLDCPPPEPGACSALVPKCEANECVLGCGEVACNDITCENGFAVDAAGCLTCECSAGPTLPECTLDEHCTRVAADCCGCTHGGADTAVPIDQADEWEMGLGCPPDPVCPGVDVCTPGEVARCNAGRCQLGPSDPGVVPAGACGTPELPPYPAGQDCVLNSDDGATEEGLGICQ